MNAVTNTTLEIYQYPDGSTKVMKREPGTQQTYQAVEPDGNVWLVAPGLALVSSEPTQPLIVERQWTEEDYERHEVEEQEAQQ